MKTLFSTLLLLSLLTACQTDFDEDKDGVKGKRDKCPTQAASTPDGCPVGARAIGGIHFYLETSASMGGYFKGQEFKDIIADLTSKIDKEIAHDKPMDIWYTAETTTRFNGNAQDFSSAIARVQIAPQKSSQLHAILKNIAAKTGKDDISLLVSDCILSFPDADIRANKEINAQNASSTLKSNVYGTFKDLKARGMGASIYAFRSGFNGTYYDYQNGKKSLSGVQRPFYVWVIGDAALLASFNQQLAEISSFRPAESMHFGGSATALKKYEVISQMRPRGVGTWMKSADGITDVDLDKGQGTVIPLAVNLAGLPPYAQKPAYLDEHLRIRAKGCAATIATQDIATADRSRVTSEPQKRALEGATHVLMLNIASMNLSDAEVEISLPAEAPTWHQAWSCMDDRNLAATCAGKTFALEHLIQGVQDAYEERADSYVDLKVALKK